MKRGFDALVALIALVLASPILIVAAIAVKLSSDGPIFYLARRVGIGAREFRMVKFRTMRVASGGPAITAPNDPRVFKVGAFLRASKIDELPQFYNVLVGDMSLVGPRPEDPGIVEKFYTPWMRDTLNVRPGVTSPGTIYFYAHSDEALDDGDPEGSYGKGILARKLAVDCAYLERANFASDVACMLRTAWAIVMRLCGFTVDASKVDIEAAHELHPHVFAISN